MARNTSPSRTAAVRPRLGRTLKRFLGLIACGGLVAASVWINGQTNAEEATPDANPFERYRASSPNSSGSSAKATDLNRRKVEDQMRQARLALRNGDADEALRLASTADQMARQWKVSFKANEQTPTALMALIQGPVDDGTMVAQGAGETSQGVQTVSATDDPHAYVQSLLTEAQTDIRQGHLAAAREKIETARNTNVEYSNFDLRPEQVMAELAKQQKASPTGPSEDFATVQKARSEWNSVEKDAPTVAPAADTADNLSLKEQAQELVALARESLEKGHYEEARTFAMAAQKLDVNYGLLDEHPQHVLAEIERRSKSVVLSGAPSAARPVKAAASSDETETLHAEALDLLAGAREALKSGQLSQAKKLAEQAAQLDVAYAVFDDRPELVLQEIRTAESRSAVAATQKSGGPASPAAASNEKANANQLVSQARQALKAGDLAAARELVAQAEQIDVAYGTFDDRPEMVREDIERLVSGQSGRKAPAATQASLEEQKQSALALVDEGRAALAAGQVAEAQAKAQQARQFDVAYELFEDTPEMLLADIDRAAQQAPGATNRGVMTAQAGFDRHPVVAEGSARELYDQGVNALRQGDRVAAYQAFLAAYQTGEKLDGYRQQQLQDKLRELAPRHNQIQQVSGEQVADGADLGGDPSLMTEAVQMNDARFDKLRTETLNTVFRAERLRERKPAEAQAMLEEQLAAIEAAGLAPEQAEPLAVSVRNSLTGVEAYMKQRAPVLEMERKNGETRDRVEREIQTRVRVEQELATLVDKFNELMDQKRFAEAQAIAKQAKELDSSNPVVVNMKLKSQFAFRNEQNARLQSDKEDGLWKMYHDAELGLVNPVADGRGVSYPKDWKELNARRKAQPIDGRDRSETEERIYSSLKAPVSVHFDNSPLKDILNHIAESQGINVAIDMQGLADAGSTESTPVTISVDGVRLESALNLMLAQLQLDYVVENETLMITSKSRRQGDMKVVTYQVADLVTPLSARAPTSAVAHPSGIGSGAFSVPGMGGLAQVPAEGGLLPTNSSLPGLNSEQGLSEHDFRMLTDLITATVEPDSWEVNAGQASIATHDSTLSLVIRQTQKVHQEISDLLSQLRRLQDLQVTIEVRYISVSDRFFEQIGVDFDFNVNDTVGGPRTNSQFNPLSGFGTVDPVNGTSGGAGQTGSQQGGGGQQGGQQNQAGQGGGNTGAVGPFAPGPRINLVGRDSWPGKTVVGMSAPGQFSGDLDVPFRQGSFDLAAPTFGNFDPAAGIQFGMAILSDIEAFLFVRAAQGDRRSNIMFAPKITLFNGSFASIFSGTNRPFVTSLTPVSSGFSIGFQPQLTTIREGTNLSVQAVVSSDRRYVRLSVAPDFTNITDVQTFSFAGGSAGGLAGGQGGGGQQGQGGFGGQGGGLGGAGGQGQGGQGGQGQQQNGGGGLSAAVQLPIVAQVTVSTVVSVPDGGTVLLGGVKSLSEGRNMAGVPILNKIPYISRLFRNTGVGRETSSLMMMVTPRIIIQEEEEELLGLAE